MAPTPLSLDEILPLLNDQQLRFVAARQRCNTDKDAAEMAGVSLNGMYQWKNKDLVNEAVRLIALDGVITARETIRRGVSAAAEVKVQALESKNEWIKQAAASEILDRILGKPVQVQKVEQQISVDVEGLDDFLTAIYGKPDTTA